MTRLVPNPIGELSQPLQRVETAVTTLCDELSEVRSLPAIQRELVEVNSQLASVLAALQGLRDDLARLPEASANGRGQPPSGRRRQGRATS